MAGSSSPLPSPPSGIMRSASLSAHKIYSRRASAIREKRRAEALVNDTDSDEDGNSDTFLKRSKAVEDGSPISKKTKSSSEKRNIQNNQTRISPRNLSSARNHSSSSFVEARSPSPSPPPIKRFNSMETTTSSSTTSPANKRKASQKQSAPIVDIHPPSSSPPLPPDTKAPSTPPRKIKSLSKNNTPQASPSSFEDLFANVSPRKDYFDDSPSRGDNKLPTSPGAGISEGSKQRLTRPGGMRRMLTKTQSMSALPITPSKDQNEDIEESPKNAFGGSMEVSPSSAISPQRPSTPNKNLSRTKSMPESPSKSSPKNQDNSSLGVNTVTQGAGGSGGRAKRTYGGKRSMLAEVSKVNLELSNVSEDDVGISENAPEVSYAELRKKFETDNEETDNGSGNLMAELLVARAPQAVSDMRSKGENRRFMDELNCLIEGIGDPTMGISFKRTSALDIIRNMQDESWLAKMEICGQIEIVWGSLMQAGGEEYDMTMETICILFLAILIKSNTGIDQLMRNNRDQAMNLLLRNLNTKNGPLDQSQKTKLSNSASTRILASSTLNSICGMVAEQDDMDIIDDPIILKQVLDSLILETKILGDRFDLHEKGLDLLPQTDPPDSDHIYYLLQIIFRLVEGSEECKDKMEDSQTESVQALVNVVITATAVWLNVEDESSPNVSRCIGQILQLLIVLATSSPEWIRSFLVIRGASTALLRSLLQREHIIPVQTSTAPKAREEESRATEVEMVEQAEPDTTLLQRDFLCTILVLLIQAIRTDAKVVQILANTSMSSRCKGNFGCLRKCNCLDQLSFTHHLSQIYSDYQQNDDDIFAKAITGYLALVIINFLLSNSSIEQESLSPLPGQNVKGKLEGLRGSLRGLLYEVHHNLRQILSGPSDENESAEDDGEDEIEMENVKEALKNLDDIISKIN
ncbi:uncharacterized protein I206_104062 [Kwoniella pini CBS 10737]|uniref:Wings apart-like protein C-terminal domain-containing protein n=1 Tax=Kwoniella pini CBS 10737 TaxID=1296096 RepID=A0A1B9I2V4_9TREE|nr:uncharacterized protein I206_04362 [Kwoniella pini CBS 10737]OCF49835.1 hypothetical protein I206_04362 [Kwoniella pini CBS 10737]